MEGCGDMQKLLAARGCEVIYAPLETPSAIGKVERAQGVMKAMLRKIVHDTECVGAKKNWNCSPRSPGGQKHHDQIQLLQPKSVGAWQKPTCTRIRD